ncbi:MAG: hypothetical protein IPL93_04465 [Actinomycetales bacterium]|nr:hypothetical protein [Actinomycetales bacterium]
MSIGSTRVVARSLSASTASSGSLDKVSESNLRELADTFASELTQTLATVARPGSDSVVFEAVLLEDSPDVAFVQQAGSAALELCTREGPLLDLEASYRCRRSQHRNFLAVVESKVRVTPHGATEPLVRYEFLETPHGIPAAHVQVHGDHPTWIGVFESISGTRRARKHRRRQRVSDLHFPVGGRRFRPCLEDVLEMLILEFNVVPSPDQETALEALRAGRAAWRAHQLGAAVADNPAVAVRVLTQLGYEVIWRGQRSEPEARVDRLREL